MKALLGALLLVVSLSVQAELQNVFKGVVSLQVLCTPGGPEELMEELLESYNEKPVHAIIPFLFQNSVSAGIKQMDAKLQEIAN